MKTVFKVTAITALIVASASASAWFGNNGLGYAPHAPYGYAPPVLTEEQQKAMAEQQKQAFEHHTKMMEFQRQAAEAYAKQQAEAYKQFMANAPQAPQAMPDFQRPEFPGFQSHDEVIKQMESRHAEMEKQFVAHSVPGFAAMPAEMKSREEVIKEIEAHRAKIQKEMDERGAKFR